MSLYKIIVWAPLLIIVLLTGNLALGDIVGTNPTCPAGTVCLPNPLGSGASDVLSLLYRVINYLVLIAAPIVSILIIYGAYQILFAAGDTEKFATGRKTILYAVIGYAIILIGFSLVYVIKEILTGTPSTP